MKDKASPSWSIVSFVKDTPENIRLFVSYHLGIGASHICLFFDDPDDPCAGMLSGLERVSVYRCDEDFWQMVAGRPVLHRHGVRQNTAITFGYELAEEDWVLHLDADEFLHIGNDDPAGFLADVPDETLSVRLRPAEQVYVDARPQQDFYRLPLHKHDVKDVHGEFAINFIRRQGFFGHQDGKSFTRNGLDGVGLRPHWAHYEDGSIVDFMDVPASPEHSILHRNAENLDKWLEKLEFRLETASIPGRLRGFLLELIEAEDAMGICEVHKKLFSFSEEQYSKMQALGAIFACESRLDRFVADYFPEESAKVPE